jgi:ankyrin repeat protein
MHDIATFLIVEHSQDVNARGFDIKETPLHFSSGRGDVEVARVLLKHGADTETRDRSDYSPLDRAVMWEYVELAQVLLEHGANVNSTGQEKVILRCIVHANRGKPAVALVLLRHGADVKSRNRDNETPLHRAGHEVAQLLLEHGADANALDIKNRTPLHHISEDRMCGSCSGPA